MKVLFFILENIKIELLTQKLPVGAVALELGIWESKYKNRSETMRPVNGEIGRMNLTVIVFKGVAIK